MSSLPHDPAESLLARFLASHSARDSKAFEAWARAQSELAADAALLARVERLRAQVARSDELLGGAAPAGGFFGRGGTKRADRSADDSSLGASFTPGQRVGTFKLTRFLAQGGMGQVWEAYDEELRRPVALKFVRPDHVDARSLERFEREARAGGRLNHPSIVRTLAFNGSGAPAWIAQELVEGSWTLKDFLDELRAEDKTPEGYYRKAAELVASLAEGLEAAHQARVIHRDIKPQNILIAPDDSPKLTDFGLARVIDDSFLSVTGEFAGTYAYMSPEQVTAKRIGLDHRSDIFSLGVVLYELLSLRRPFEGDTTHQISQKILFFEPPEPSKVRSQCPRELSIICGKALEKDPDRRYATMAEFAADLRRHLADEPIHARPPGTLVRVIKWARRNPGPSSAAAVGTIALAVISGLLVKQVRTANDLAESNLALEQSNVDLASQTQRAEASERESRANADQARRNAEEAERNAAAAQLALEVAEKKTNDVLSLSAQKDHDGLVAEAAKLWPAHPETIPAYEDWLRRANELINGRPADESKGLKKRPSLEEHKAKLAELRAEAKPLSEAEIQAERASHPKYAELQAKQAELLWRSRMLGDEPWPSEAAAEAELAKESLPTDADALNSLAWPLVDPAKPIYGQEVRALLLARRAVAAASEEKRSGIRDTLAWALLKVGRFDEALSEERTAQSEPGGEALKSSAADLEKAVGTWRGEELAKRRGERDALGAEVATLAAQVNERRTYEFADPEKEWWNRHLAKLVSDLELLRDPQTGLMNDVLAEPFGWGVAKRYEFAQSIGKRSVDGAEARSLWSEAIAAIKSSPKYGGLEIMPQMGLLPIGMDPDSQLWEFAHLQTGAPAVRGADGKLVLNEETGLVFVLIPSGTFLWQAPQHEVKLGTYFLSKYEMTQGQWQRIAASNPSGFHLSVLHPVQQVSWPMCSELLEHMGLSLPSEAQWTCAARSAEFPLHWIRSDTERDRRRARASDRSLRHNRAGAASSGLASGQSLEELGLCVVGTHAANGYGFHEMGQSVWEWCLDENLGSLVGEGGNPKMDPVATGDGTSSRSLRGGEIDPRTNVDEPWEVTRWVTPESRSHDVGLRPSRALRLSPSPLHPPK
ncbi:MAG: protein kinase [Planctomycetaceae bacterium]|nr:protein kinase [Planctomycetaceae bacterium]